MPLCYAGHGPICFSPPRRCLMCLLCHGCRGLQNGEDEQTPLMTAAKRGHTEVVRALLSAGAADLQSKVHTCMRALCNCRR